MSNDDIFHIIIPGAVLLCVLMGYFLWSGKKKQRLHQRIQRVTARRGGAMAVHKSSADALTLRKNKDSKLPFITKILHSITIMDSLRARLERAGSKVPPDVYVALSGGATILSALVVILLRKPPVLALLVGLMVGIVIPYLVVGIKGTRRIKKFLTLFPDAIDFIVRGLRSGLPATESMNMVGAEMEEPIGSIFAGIGESVRLGVSVEKALNDTAKKLGSTEFNFFVTSIVLQRETGGNLSEILSNLSDVLRKRFMMRMKIKAMASEAKASAIIVGALPFVVILALSFVSPGYLMPLIDDSRGHMAAAAAAFMMTMGIGIMIKMTRFEI